MVVLIRRLLRRSGSAVVLGATAALAAGLLGLGWYDNHTTRTELLALVEAHALTLRETVAAAARTNATASALAEAQIAARVRDNARLLAALDRVRPLDEALVDSVAQRNDLFRVMVFGADGRREFTTVSDAQGTATSGGRGPGPGAGPGAGGGRGPGEGFGRGPGTAGLVQRVLAGEQEVVGDVHAGRRGGAGRLAAAVRRARGGAILGNADATAVLSLQAQASLDALLGEVVTHAADVAYVSVETPDGQRAAGPVPASQAAGLETLQPGEVRTFELDVDGRPVREFAGPVARAGEGAPLTVVRIGMRMDEIRRIERRFLVRQAASLVAAVLLGAVGLGLVWLNARYGTLADAHRKAREALERRDRLAAMGELASTVAHEIRNPLNAIAMSAQRLQREAFADGAGDDEHRDLVGVIRREADRISARVQQFVTFARPPALQLAPVALGPWLEGLTAALASAAQMKSITLAVDVTHAGTADIDAEQLRQAVDNLIRNAMDATPAGGRIDVSARSARDAHRIVVRDSGPGIPPDVLPRIFDLYFTTKRDGTGVGLAVSQQIVAGHRGRLEVESAPGAGATFTIVLPPTS